MSRNRVPEPCPVCGGSLVHVREVRVMNYLGKMRRMGRFTGRRPDWKKAVVTLKQGERIESLER